MRFVIEGVLLGSSLVLLLLLRVRAWPPIPGRRWLSPLSMFRDYQSGYAAFKLVKKIRRSFTTMKNADQTRSKLTHDGSQRWGLDSILIAGIVS
jgi:hypothetical protein